MKKRNIVIWIQTVSYVYSDKTEDVETRLLSKRNNKKVIGVIKDEKKGKTYIYLTDDGKEDKIS